jgi:arginine/lysine/ornithine decarboxylase
MDQNETPVLDAIEEYRRQGNHTFALPGHRLGEGIDARTASVLSRGAFQADVITAKQAVPDAERLLAEAVGAREAVFTTCGSSISIHTAMLTVTGPGKKILVDRNVHKSVVASLILAGAEPVWLRPRWDHERQIAHPAPARDVEAALERDPDVSAVLIITPTEYGTGADLRGIAEICHRRGIPLLVDEAWGAHFPFHPGLPTAAIQAGADLVVQSLHKADGGLCQASLILLGGDLVDPTDLRLRLDLITTTSPSALMFGSIDGFRHRMVREGRQLLDDALHRAGGVRMRLSKVSGLKVIDESIIGQDGVAEWDPLKLGVDVSALGISGYQAKDWLQEQRRITAQLDGMRCLVDVGGASLAS